MAMSVMYVCTAQYARTYARMRAWARSRVHMCVFRNGPNGNARVRWTDALRVGAVVFCCASFPFFPFYGYIT